MSRRTIERCIECRKIVRNNQHGLQCDTCNRWQHRTCNTGVSLQLYRDTMNGCGLINWWCKDCDVPENPVPPVELSADGHPENTAVSSEAPEEQVSAEISDVGEPIVESTRLSNVHQPMEVDTPDEPEPEHQPNQQAEPMDSSFDITQRSFVIPQPIEEDSVDSGELPTTIDDDEENVTYYVIESGSNKGKKKLCDSLGYSYTIRKESKKTTFWWCSVRNKKTRCPASVSQCGQTFKPGRHNHVHAAQPGIHKAIEIRTEVKEQAKTNLFQSAATVVERVMQEKTDLNLPSDSRPSVSLLTRTANRVREHQRPKEPRDTAFELATDFLPANFLVKDIRYKDQRYILFSTPDQLELLARSKQWFMDGTFKVVKDPFYQLLSWHSFIQNGCDMKMIPLAFCLMSRRRTVDYKKVMKALLKALPTSPKVQRIVSDFERGIWKSIREVLPEVELKGCAFHWAQAIFRKVSDLGLKVAYCKNASVNTFIKKLMALPHIPPEHIPSCFRELKARCPEDKAEQLNRLVSYIEKTWVTSSVWPVNSWSVYNCSVRTNNDVEGWHRRLNKKAGEEQKPFYVLIPLLHEEASQVPLQTTLVAEGKLSRYQRKSVRTDQRKLFDLWKRYSEGEIGVSKLLKKCANISL